MAAILRDEMGKGPFKALLHCFTASRMLAETGVELGLYVSFSGVLTFKNSQDLRDIARDVPLDRLLVETDAPFLAPTPYPRQAQRTRLCRRDRRGAGGRQGRERRGDRVENDGQRLAAVR